MERPRREDEGALRQAVESLERRMIIAALISAKGRMNSAAESLGISIRIMGLRVRKYGIDLRAYRRLTYGTPDDEQSWVTGSHE